MLQPVVQDNSKATYCFKITKSDGQIDLDKLTAEEIYNLFRAYKNFPKITIINEIYKLGEGFRILDCIPTSPEIIILEKDYLVVDNQNNIYLKCKNNSYLKINIIMNKKGKKIDLKGYNL